MNEEHITLDEPAPGGAVDPLCFRVRGWLWLGACQPDIAAVEVWDGETCAGEIAHRYDRPDAVALLGLPADARAGFQIIARLPPQPPGTLREIAVRARFADGTRTPALLRRQIVAGPLAASPHGALLAALPENALGLEVGAHAQPVTGLAPFYTDNVAAFAGIPGKVDFLSSALALPLPDGTLDYLCTSHVLEHIADPIAALLEWERVLRPGGFLYLVVPDMRRTFDHPRRVTPVPHLLDDFTTPASFERDAPHLHEFVHEIDWSRLRYGSDPAQHPAWREAALAEFTAVLRRGESIDIHFHTFTPESLETLLRALGFIGEPRATFDVVARAEDYPADRSDGFGLLLRKRGERQRAPRRAATFQLAHPLPGRPALPLVNPVTLAPIREPARAPGGQPNLLAPSEARLRRPWSGTFRRWWIARRARRRLR